MERPGTVSCYDVHSYQKLSFWGGPVTQISLINAIKDRRKRKCLVAMPFLILSNWVNPKYAYSKMKINDHLISCRTLFSTWMANVVPFNEKETKVALSLQSFHFPQILLTCSEHTHKTAVLWK